jgi:hypothetical protein
MSVEEDQIQEGYKDEVKGMFRPFYLDFLLHGPDAAAKKFKDGLDKVMQARDLALKSIPTGSGRSTDAESALGLVKATGGRSRGKGATSQN